MVDCGYDDDDTDAVATSQMIPSSSSQLPRSRPLQQHHHHHQHTNHNHNNHNHHQHKRTRRFGYIILLCAVVVFGLVVRFAHETRMITTAAADLARTAFGSYEQTIFGGQNNSTITTTTGSSSSSSIATIPKKRPADGWNNLRNAAREKGMAMHISSSSSSSTFGRCDKSVSALSLSRLSRKHPPLIKAADYPEYRRETTNDVVDGKVTKRKRTGTTTTTTTTQDNVTSTIQEDRNYVYYDYPTRYLNSGAIAPSDVVLYKAAPCLLFHREVHHLLLMHFPHAMEQLYQCVDYWFDHHHPTMTPLLLYNESTSQDGFVREPDGTWHNEVPFLMGVMSLLKSQLGLQIMSLEEYYDGHVPSASSALSYTSSSSSIQHTVTKRHERYFHPNQTVQVHKFPQGYLVRYPKEWTRMITQQQKQQQQRSREETGGSSSNDDNVTDHHHQPQQEQQQQQQQQQPPVPSSPAIDDDDDGYSCERGPRITILNRQKTREILNAVDLVERIGTTTTTPNGTVPASNRTTTSTTTTTLTNTTFSTIRRRTPRIVYFEGTTFEEQVNVFQSTDILISPHGAQLTGIVFMGNKPCGQVLEIFPERYAIPYYFGTLAVQSGLSHSYLYLGYGHGNASEERERRSGLRPLADPKREGGRTGRSRMGVGGRTTTSSSKGPEPIVIMPWETARGDTLEKRTWARSAQLCPSLDAMVDAIQELTRDWYECCHRNQNQRTKKKR